MLFPSIPDRLCLGACANCDLDFPRGKRGRVSLKTRIRNSRWHISHLTSPPRPQIPIGRYGPCCHYGGGMSFGPDGALYLTTGDMGAPGSAQDMTSANGKVGFPASDRYSPIAHINALWPASTSQPCHICPFCLSPGSPPTQNPTFLTAFLPYPFPDFAHQPRWYHPRRQYGYEESPAR